MNLKGVTHMLKENGIIALIVVLAGLLSYVIYYGKKELHGFESKVVLDTSKAPASMKPYSEDVINSLAQYEEEVGHHRPTFEEESVFTGEGDRQVKKELINNLMKQYPMDWSNQPPSSSKFQSGQAKYIESFTSPSSAETLSDPYKAIGDGNLVPPDTIKLEREEREILATYAPKHADDLTKYHLDDAEALISKVYKDRGMTPEVVRKDGNVFEVVRTRSTKQKVEYEDDLRDAPTSKHPIATAGEATIYIPPVATETASSLDPYFEPTTSTRSDRSDYTQWTPGLQRMFAPTNPTKDWIGK